MKLTRDLKEHIVRAAAIDLQKPSIKLKLRYEKILARDALECIGTKAERAKMEKAPKYWFDSRSRIDIDLEDVHYTAFNLTRMRYDKTNNWGRGSGRIACFFISPRSLRVGARYVGGGHSGIPTEALKEAWFAYTKSVEQYHNNIGSLWNRVNSFKKWDNLLVQFPKAKKYAKKYVTPTSTELSVTFEDINTLLK